MAADLLTMMISSRFVNQPFGLNQFFVCVGPGGIMKNEITPTASVSKPSIRKRYRQPARFPERSKRIPVAIKALTITVM